MTKIERNIPYRHGKAFFPHYYYQQEEGFNYPFRTNIIMSDITYSDHLCDKSPAIAANLGKGSEFNSNAAKISTDSGEDDGCVQVAIRVRPMLPNETGTTECIDVLRGASRDQEKVDFHNVLRLGGSSGPNFTFDQVFGAQTLQGQVYRDRVAPLVANCLEGYNATVLAYGQTGSGKTHTIMGGGITSAMMQESHQGVLPRAIRNIFQQLKILEENSNDGSSYEYEVRVQFLELYGEEIRDLLNPRPQTGTSSSHQKLTIRDFGNEEPEVVGATMHKVDSPEEALMCLTSGMYRRVTASTAMNEASSRSHAILSIVVEQSIILNVDSNKQSPASKRLNSAEEEEISQVQGSDQHVQSKVSRFNFVDLAGSERQKRTQATGQRLKEGIDINKGLFVLGNVISALGDIKKQGSFVPYRDSKLTRLLKGSLGGNHKTLMIACVSPSSSNMEETLNCLRYANRAKNIQNHAVVNLDATSQIVTNLKQKIQRLAIDLVKTRTGRVDECSFSFDVIEAMAKGIDGDEEDNTRITNTQTTVFRSPSKSGTYDSSYQINSPVERKSEYSYKVEAETQKLRTENEAYRLQVESISQGKDPSNALQKAYVTKAIEYEREISRLKNEIQANKNSVSRPVRFKEIPIINESFSRKSNSRSESPELSRLKTQIFGSLAKSSTLDAEMDAEEKAVEVLSNKYLSHPTGDGDFVEKNQDDGCGDSDVHARSTYCSIEDAQSIGQSIDSSSSLDASLYALSNSISAKEALINKLQASQEKYESMKEFYEEKLKEMGTIVFEKETEAEKLSEEIRKLDVGHSKSKELSDMLKHKQAQVKELKRKKSELARLTNVAARNESQINRLKNDVTEMKHKKVDLQKQMTAERKSHMVEVRGLKKASMKKDHELNKVRREANKQSHEALKAQKIAKSRLDQMSQLKQRYKDTEKRLRMQTVKRGVLKKAGLDPVIFGRRQLRELNDVKMKPKNDCINHKTTNVDELRDFFDRKVADVGRRENIAEKLAQEWEEHLELTIQKEESLQADTEGQHESLLALGSAIKYREERIRHLASRLGKRGKKPEQQHPQNSDDSFLFDNTFYEIFGEEPMSKYAKIAAKVLFGMVVRERRRIASLARTASSLDEKVQETESSLANKDAAFRAYVDEQRLEAASLAQSQQEHILSLMEMVKEDQIDESETPDATKFLVLANERINALQQQLNETQINRDAVQRYQKRELSVQSKLKEKINECEDFEEEIDQLRSALRSIREEIIPHGDNRSVNVRGEQQSPLLTIQDIVARSLHSSSMSMSSKSRRQSSGISLRVNSPSLKQKRGEIHSPNESDEVPEWAEDIMRDLATIADGKMPSALLHSQEVLEAEAQLNNNVFDRLTNPESFTGVQKLRSAKLNATILEEKEKKKENITKKSKERSLKKKDSAKRTVFDRLLSPSNATGTQKQRLHRINDQKGRVLEEAIENQHVSLRGRSRVREYESDGTEDERETMCNLTTHNRESDGSEKRNEMHGYTKFDEYTRLDVFDRLNKTTTQAYKEKVHSNIAEKMLDDILLDGNATNAEIDYEVENLKSGPHFDRVDEYIREDVFERLQRNTTEAYAKKKNNAFDELHAIRSSPNGTKAFDTNSINHG